MCVCKKTSKSKIRDSLLAESGDVHMGSSSRPAWDKGDSDAKTGDQGRSDASSDSMQVDGMQSSAINNGYDEVDEMGTNASRRSLASSSSSSSSSSIHSKDGEASHGDKDHEDDIELPGMPSGSQEDVTPKTMESGVVQVEDDQTSTHRKSLGSLANFTQVDQNAYKDIPKPGDLDPDDSGMANSVDEDEDDEIKNIYQSRLLQNGTGTSDGENAGNTQQRSETSADERDHDHQKSDDVPCDNTQPDGADEPPSSAEEHNVTATSNRDTPDQIGALNDNGSQEEGFDKETRGIPDSNHQSDEEGTEKMQASTVQISDEPKSPSLHNNSTEDADDQSNVQITDRYRLDTSSEQYPDKTGKPQDLDITPVVIASLDLFSSDKNSLESSSPHSDGHVDVAKDSDTISEKKDDDEDRDSPSKKNADTYDEFEQVLTPNTPDSGRRPRGWKHKHIDTDMETSYEGSPSYPSNESPTPLGVSPSYPDNEGPPPLEDKDALLVGAAEDTKDELGRTPEPSDGERKHRKHKKHKKHKRRKDKDKDDDKGTIAIGTDAEYELGYTPEPVEGDETRRKKTHKKHKKRRKDKDNEDNVETSEIPREARKKRRRSRKINQPIYIDNIDSSFQSSIADDGVDKPTTVASDMPIDDRVVPKEKQFDGHLMQLLMNDSVEDVESVADTQTNPDESQGTSERIPDEDTVDL